MSIFDQTFRRLPTSVVPTLIASAILTIANELSATEAATRPPSIVLLLADDN